MTRTINIGPSAPPTPRSREQPATVSPSPAISAKARPGRKPKTFEGAARPSDSRTTEPPEELLRAVGRHAQAENQSHDQKSDTHHVHAFRLFLPAISAGRFDEILDQHELDAGGLQRGIMARTAASVVGRG